MKTANACNPGAESKYNFGFVRKRYSDRFEFIVIMSVVVNSTVSFQRSIVFGYTSLKSIGNKSFTSF